MRRGFFGRCKEAWDGRGERASGRCVTLHPPPEDRGGRPSAAVVSVAVWARAHAARCRPRCRWVSLRAPSRRWARRWRNCACWV
ncbi:MAG: hypothetical protein M0C28_31960 [Candidatus Moduliflexus flocculans]|nr:hypothetical protein [Candidatus Moduliflexus flocculans]